MKDPFAFHPQSETHPETETRFTIVPRKNTDDTLLSRKPIFRKPQAKITGTGISEKDQAAHNGDKHVPLSTLQVQSFQNLPRIHHPSRDKVVTSIEHAIRHYNHRHHQNLMAPPYSEPLNGLPTTKSTSTALTIFDVLDLIFAYLPPTTLKSCLSVSKIFHSVATRYLYRSPRLRSRRHVLHFFETIELAPQPAQKSVPFWVRFVKHLDFTRSPHQSLFTESKLISVASHSTLQYSLRSIQLAEVTDKALSALLLQCVHLHDLTIENGSTITDQAFKSLVAQPEGSPHRKRIPLYSLRINQCGYQLSNESIQILAQTCLRLRELYLSAAKSVRGEALSRLCEQQPFMSVLSIQKCGRWTDEDIIRLAECAFRLKTLRLDSNSGEVSSNALKFLLRHTQLEHVCFIRPLAWDESLQHWVRTEILSPVEVQDLLIETPTLRSCQVTMDEKEEEN